MKRISSYINFLRLLKTVFLFLFISSSLFGQSSKYSEFYGPKASEIIPGTRYVQLSPKSPFPSYVKFEESQGIPFPEFFGWLNGMNKSEEEFGFELMRMDEDAIGYQHYHYRQTYKSLPIDLTFYILHVKNNLVESFNGSTINVEPISIVPVLTEADALQAVLEYVGAEMYAWEDEYWESRIKKRTKDESATHYPKGKLVISHDLTDRSNPRVAYLFHVFAVSPFGEKQITVDASNGTIINNIKMESHCGDPATVNTVFNGNQTIQPDRHGITCLTCDPPLDPRHAHFLDIWYDLRDDCDGPTHEIQDWNSTVSDPCPFSPQPIENMDNIWTTQDERFGGSVLWQTRESYEYFRDVHGRASYDNSNGDVDGFINALFFDNDSPNNASMSFSGGFMKVGIGTPSGGPLGNSYATLDIIGHEYAHAVTGSSAMLIYEREWGALNESFSDIFGEMVELETLGSNDWLIGQERDNGAIRSMSNPNDGNDPDTYQGTNWKDTTPVTCDNDNDQCGVHSNSGVQNFWFYLLSEGGTGTNDNGDAYNVTGIGSDKAAAIAFRNLITKLGCMSDFADARVGAIASAEELFGECSLEAVQTALAWSAVGVGSSSVSSPQFVNCPLQYTFGTDPDQCSVYANWSAPVAVDLCGFPILTVQQTVGPLPGTEITAANSPYTVEYTATDFNGNQTTCSFIVTVVETQDPFVSCPDNRVVGTDTDACNAVVNGIAAPFSFDNCPSGLSWTAPGANPNAGNGDASGSTFPEGTTTVTYTITETDNFGNDLETASCSFTVTVVDDQPPTINTQASNMSVECDGAGNTTALNDWLLDKGGASATDNCSNIVSWTNDLLTIDDNCGGTVVYTYLFTADDTNGNTSTTIASFSIVDTTMPEITGGEDITVDCDQTGSDTAFELISWLENNGYASATDICSEPIVWSNDFDIDNFQHGCMGERDITVNFTATDDCGNFSSIALSFSVVDTIAPRFINCPRPDIVENTEANHCDAYVNFASLIAEDNCSDVTISNLSPYNPATGKRYKSGDRFPAGTTIMTWRAEDPCGNYTICKFKIIVNDYWDEPSIICPGDITSNNDDWLCSADVTISNPGVTDVCPDLVVTTYQIEFEGDILQTGLVDIGDLDNPSNKHNDDPSDDTVTFDFPVGKSTVTYCVQDQPLLLITEITHDVTNECGGMDEPPFDILGDVTTNDYIEITNFGPAAYDLSCLVICRTFEGESDLFIVPEDTTVQPGETLVVCFGHIEQENEDCLTPENTDCLEANGTPGCDNQQCQDLICDFDPFCCDTDWDAQCVNEALEFCNLCPCEDNPSQGDCFENNGTVGCEDCECQEAICAFDPYCCDVEWDQICADEAAAEPVCLNMAPVDMPLPKNVFALETTLNLDPGDEAVYKIYYGDNFIDDVTMSEEALGGMSRIAIKDTDTDEDWVFAGVCNPITIGEYNPGYPTPLNNGTTTSLQSVPAKTDYCEVLVTIIDDEDPLCKEIDGRTSDKDEFTVDAVVCNEFSLTLEDCLAEDVTVNITGDAFPARSIILFTPAGNEIELLIEDQFTGDLSAVLQDYLYSEKIGGTWLLEVVTEKDLDGSFNLAWTLEAECLVDWVMDDVTLSNDPELCTREFTWTHPFAVDNCRDVTISVDYDVTVFNDLGPDPVVPEDEVLDGYGGYEVTEIFSVGYTKVTYTLIDQYGNEGECSFIVKVNDDEIPEIICPDEIIVNLNPGECRRSVCYLDQVFRDDNCGVKMIMGTPPNCSEFEIGLTVVDVTVTDIHGNTNTCAIDIIVNEFIPESDELACNDHINLTLGEDCMAPLTADMILEGNIYRCYEKYCVEITDSEGNVIVESTPFYELEFYFETEHLNQVFNIKIIDCLGAGNSCWGTVLVEEKHVPDVACPPDVTIYCSMSVDPEDLGYPKLLTCEPLADGFTYEDEVENFDNCNDPRSIITRTWTFDDNQGHIVTCPQIITVIPVDLTKVKAPADIDLDQALECGDVEDYPYLLEPDYTGYPMIDGYELPKVNTCRIAYSHWDKRLSSCTGDYAITRTWEIIDLCLPQGPNNPVIRTQLIKVFDTEPPIIVGCPGDITISTAPYECSASFDLPLPANIYDRCSDGYLDAEILTEDVELDIYYDGSGKVSSIFVDGLERGTHTIVYTVSDECGNSRTCSFDITVVDAIAPIAVADEHTVVSLTTSGDGEYGTAKLFAESLDDGSHDICTDVYFEVRREDGSPHCDNHGEIYDIESSSLWNNNITYDNTAHPNDSPFDTDGGEFVKFCCEDLLADGDGDGQADGLVKVWLRVWDDGDQNGEYGTSGDNYSEAWVYVQVQDKFDPVIYCPPDVTLECGQDPLDLYLTGHGSAQGTCSEVPVTFEDEDLRDECGVGRIYRTWFVDENGDGYWTPGEVRCNPSQIIDNLISDPFDIDNIYWPVNYDDTELPDQPSFECLPGDTGEPAWDELDCSLVGATLETDTFFFEEDACYKILNHWTIIDWCQYKPNIDEDFGVWQRTQVIKVIDESAPEFDYCGDIELKATEDCIATVPYDFIDGSRNELSMVATDNGNCPSAWLKWEVCLDVWGDGFCEYLYTSNKAEAEASLLDNVYYLPASASGQKVEIPYDNAEDPYDPTSFSLDYGVHKVIWTVNDGCGNLQSCSSYINVLDRKPPTPICISNLATAVMNESGTVDIWAIDFDKGSFDNCTRMEDLTISFSGTDYEPSRTIDCGDLTQNGSTQIFDFEMWVWDASGNRDYCSVQLRVDDNLGVCGGNAGLAMIAGQLQTEYGDMIENVEMELNSAYPEYPVTQMTNENGAFAFGNNPMLQHYEVSGEKNDDYPNGVSTLDMVLIQLHVLGIELLDSPYKIIAADVNADEKVSALDLVQLRKLVLGVYDELPNNDSWRFIDIGQSFENSFHPWPLQEVLDIEGLYHDMMNEDFIGVKIGDVNGSAAANNFMSAEVRTRGSLTLVADEVDYKPGDELRVAVAADEFTQVFGYQFTLDHEGLTYVGVEPGILDIGSQNIGVFDDRITTSWNTDQAISSEDVLFTLVFYAESEGKLSNTLHLNSNITNAESYVGSSMEVLGVELEVREGETVIEALRYKLYQNEPNPFSESTIIGFDLPSADRASITLYDVAGQVIKVIEGPFAKGYNEVSVERSELGAAGLYYYQLDSGSFTASKKMIIIR